MAHHQCRMPKNDTRSHTTNAECLCSIDNDGSIICLSAHQKCRMSKNDTTYADGTPPMPNAECLKMTLHGTPQMPNA
jgi:hypothetical protein